MTSPANQSEILRVSELRNTSPTRFSLQPDDKLRTHLAEKLEISGIRKLRFEGVLTPQGKKGWKLEADLGATVVQPCIVTLEPVTTRLDQKVVRSFLPEAQVEQYEAGSESEMPDDDSIEALGEVIDLTHVMTESLSLALPAYPRKSDAALENAQFSEDGVTPMTDEDTKPFAGLAALKDKLGGNDENG